MTKCAAFWNHTNLRSGNRVFPCCRFKEPIATFSGDPSEILNLPEYEELRNKSDSGEFIDGCQKCYHEESIGKESLRQRFNKEYTTDEISLRFLEIGFDNICNAACDGCYPEFSSEWSKILYVDKDKKNHIVSSDEITNVPSSIDKVLFLGGEPLMTNRHKRFLKLVPELSKLTVIYNTNGTFLLDEETIELLKKCKSVEFILSIDGYGELNEKVRKNCKWNDVLLFIDQIFKLEFKISINTVLHANNYHGMNDLQKFIKDLDVDWTVNILTYPKHLDIANCDNKQDIMDYLQSVDMPNKNAVMRHLT